MMVWCLGVLGLLNVFASFGRCSVEVLVFQPRWSLGMNLVKLLCGGAVAVLFEVGCLAGPKHG